MKMLRLQFRPEFLNRVDETVLFKPLTLAEIVLVVELLLKDLRQRLARQEIKLEIDKATEEYIARQGYDAVYGARPLKRFIQHHFETPISRMIIAGNLSEGSEVHAVVEDGKILFK